MAINIRIEGEGLVLEKQINMQKAGQIVAFLGIGMPELPSEESSEGSNTLPAAASSLMMSQGNRSIREVMVSSGAKTNAQKVAVLALFIKEKEGKSQFQSREIRYLFDKAGESPRNFSRDFSNAIDLQYILSTDAQEGTYELTELGEAAVKNHFAEEFAAHTPRRKTGDGKPRKTTRPAKIISEAVKGLAIDANALPGYPSYGALKVKGHRILWLLSLGDHNHINQMTPADIEYLAEKLRDKIPTSSFSALTEVSIRAGYMATATDGMFRILQPGLDLLKSQVAEKATVSA